MLNDYMHQRVSAERLGQLPCVCLVNKHERRMEHEAAIHPEIERDLKRLDGVVAAVRIAAVVRLANAGDDVLDATAVG